MPQRHLPFFEKREEDLLASLLLERAGRDQARNGKAARILHFWLGRGIRVEYTALLIVQPADETGVRCHRAVERTASRIIEKLYGQPGETVQVTTREVER